MSVQYLIVEQGDRFECYGIPYDIFNKVLSSKVVANVQHEAFHCL